MTTAEIKNELQQFTEEQIESVECDKKKGK